MDGDDLRDCYYTFIVGERRATRNAFGMVFSGSDFNGWQCYDPELASRPVLCCLNTLGMGDHLAV
eukprot:9847792-Lingulodinium_polyedra.AAC.1